MMRSTCASNFARATLAARSCPPPSARFCERSSRALFLLQPHRHSPSTNGGSLDWSPQTCSLPIHSGTVDLQALNPRLGGKVLGSDLYYSPRNTSFRRDAHAF